ncbi:hypothetical protein JTE90_004038 [Oedothorax gibbosus]|uniref:Uncharacterized protein n=1 Tax=Oedothorax gibbosus TaxID=931172 RepID=A0AAV6U6E5_9ARAC|nr:hypothetical protein JTE90_004038 [Oedothorax gibbosus]
MVSGKSLGSKTSIHVALEGMPVGSDYGDVYVNLINRRFSVTNVASRDRVLCNDPAMPVIGHAELGSAIGSQKGSKAPGPDGINPTIVKLLYRGSASGMVTLGSGLASTGAVLKVRAWALYSGISSLMKSSRLLMMMMIVGRTCRSLLGGRSGAGR